MKRTKIDSPSTGRAAEHFLAADEIMLKYGPSLTVNMKRQFKLK